MTPKDYSSLGKICPKLNQQKSDEYRQAVEQSHRFREELAMKDQVETIYVTIEAVWNYQKPPRLVQIFDNGDTVEEWCIHGIKLRWHCDKCEELQDE